MGFLLFLLRLCNFIFALSFCRLQKYEILRHFHLLKFRIVVMKDVFQLPISEGGLHCLLDRFTNKSRNLYKEIKERIEKSESIGTDETGVKVNGKKHWYWVWQTEHLTYIYHSLNRGVKTIQDVFENGLPNSILQHDRWASHFHCQAKGHQLCISHLLRDLNYLEDLYKNEWTSNMKRNFKQALELKKQLLPNQNKYPF